MSKEAKIGIFWDYENCSPPSGIPGYVVTEQIRKVAHHFGIITVFKAYLELSSTNVTPKVLSLRSELQSSGVSLTDCPRNGRKDVADKMIICDLLAFALDNPAPAVVMLISGDRDFNYAISLLRHRRYTVILVIPPVGAHITLKSQANVVLDWKNDIFAVETTEDKETYDNASQAVGHPLGANGTGVLTGTLSLGTMGGSKGGNGNGFSHLLPAITDSTLGSRGPLSPISATSRSSSVVSSSPVPAPGIVPVTSLGMHSPSTETLVSVQHNSLNETPPHKTLGLPSFGVAESDKFPPAPSASQASPAKSLTNAHRRRGSNLSSFSPRPESPTKKHHLPPGTTVDELFSIMIEILEHWRLLGNARPLRSQLGMELKKKNPWVYSGPHWNNFSEYVALAEKVGVVVLGSTGITGQDWIQLHERYQGKVYPIYI